MKALRYSVSKNTTLAFKAGCDLVLHCNGKYNEMLLYKIPEKNNFSKSKIFSLGIIILKATKNFNQNQI